MTDGVSLRDYFQALYDGHEKRIDTLITDFRTELGALDVVHEERRTAAFEQANRAIDKAEEALGKRLDLLNEFRAQVKDQTAHFVNRETYEDRHDALKDRITQIEATGIGARRAMAITFTITTMIVAVVAIALPFLVNR